MKKMEWSTFEKIAARLAEIGTIDLRMDYLRPGLGKYLPQQAVSYVPAIKSR